ncbi:zinc finger MYM-type protein 1-like [Melanaphis sacchari]|uniref:zinc finger MYM-type protein 1-like n=1 Tax=Melanaphis sacchari TaxID=742174 RepID=UPI000DC13FE1|nr:zinc finger MYM-type protein 1-like [Melanaphis sacchari]
MDIRNFFKKPKLCDSLSEASTGSNSIEINNTVNIESSESCVVESASVTVNTKNNDGHVILTNEKDIGNYLNVENINDCLKHELLRNPWVPNTTYDFKSDLKLGRTRAFRHQWLHENGSWLTYSALEGVKGAFCRICVLFKPSIHRGVQGGFIVKPFTKYKDFHASSKIHLSSNWHTESMSRAKDFMDVMKGKKISVIEQVNSGLHKEIETNRLKLKPIISTILFCGTHDLPLRGKKSDSGILKDHFLTNVGNAKYSSHRTQNELITLCGKILKEEIVCEANAANAFSIISDESADISGVEQLTIVIRFLDKQSSPIKIREEFLGFLPLDKLDAESVATKILSFMEDSGLNLSKLYGQGYDGCATMAGKVGGVAKLIRNRYNKALYFHCASHRLNLVINDLNKIMIIRNTIGTIKEIIKFYRESTLRRNLIPNIPLFCETRWSSKYKSIRLFSANFIAIIQSLQSLSVNGIKNSNTRQRALNLYSSISNFTFIISMKIIAKYSAILEPVTNILQGVSMELYKVREHVEELLKMLEDNRTNANEIFDLLFTDAKSIADDFEFTITCPRITGKQSHRNNYSYESPIDYYRVSIFLPYLDSIIQCIKERFEKSNSVAFSLQHLHPALFIKMKKQEYTESVANIYKFYKIENLLAKSESWYSLWQKKDCRSMDIIDLLEHSNIFFPSITIALEIFLSLPATSCTAERSFSTLRRVKTWLRSTTCEERLNGLCMLSVHRERINIRKEKFIEQLIIRFAIEQPRRLQFLFNNE